MLFFLFYLQQYPAIIQLVLVRATFLKVRSEWKLSLNERVNSRDLLFSSSYEFRSNT
jgi:hypothetical protein